MAHHHASDSGILVESVRKHFKGVEALGGVDLEVKPGQVLGLLGPNGAGKTTLVRILTTLIQPDAGRASVAGFDVVREASELRRVIGLAGQSAAVDDMLTGLENLELVGRLYHLPRDVARRRAVTLIEQFDLTDAGNRSAKTYSGGMRRRLDLAASLVAEPSVLFLDEPTTGLDPRSRNALWDVIRELAEGGTTVLLTTQYLEEADRLADTITVIDHGLVIAQGTADELKARSGGAVVSVRFEEMADVARAAAVLQQIAREPLRFEEGLPVINLPVTDGASILPSVVRALDDARIEVVDLALRQPTLDEVFLALTGHATTDEDTAELVGGGARRGR